jgi:tetratricopeptide (TPR) repeat protein
MLMSLGIAAVTTFLVMRVWKLNRAVDLSFYKYNLKSNGSIRNAGWAFVFFATVWTGLNVHSGWIRYHEYQGGRAFQNLQIPDELALAGPEPRRWLSPSDIGTIENGKSHLSIACEAGFLKNTDSLPKLAWLEFLSGNRDSAVELLGSAAEDQNGRAKALSLYYRGAILNRSGRPDKALGDLSEAIATSEQLSGAKEEKGESLWRLGRRSEAIEQWTQAVSENERLVMANHFLAAAFSNDAERSAEFESTALANGPKDPLFHWMIGMRLENLGMREQAERQFARALQLNPEFRRARN